MEEEKKIKRILSHWEERTNESRKGHHYNLELEENNYWLKKIRELNDLKKKFDSINSNEIIDFLKNIFTYIDSVHNFGVLKSIFKYKGNTEEIQQIFDLIKVICTSKVYDESWEEKMKKILNDFNLRVHKKAIAPSAAGKIPNIIGELFGSMNINTEAIYNGCSKNVLKNIFELKHIKNYNQFKEYFNKLKEIYEKKIGKLTVDEFPMNLELDIMLNYFDKDQKKIS